MAFIAGDRTAGFSNEGVSQDGGSETHKCSGAEAAHIRAIIILDALNEGEGLRLWPHHLSSFLAQIRHHPRLSVCFSVRSGYEPSLLPSSFSATKFIQAEHHGFANIELDAATQFFDYFGITTPSVPVL